MRFRGFVFVNRSFLAAISAVERSGFRFPSLAMMREEQKGDSR